MKTKITSLWILLGIIGMVLISGCIGEKPENIQPEQAAEQQPVQIPQEEVNETEPETETDELNETAPETVPTEEVNETAPETKEPEEETDWCKTTAAKKYGAGSETIWIEGIVEFKEKQACHLRYFSADAIGTIQYDWYFTENEEEIYKVTTYPNGTKEETKIETWINDFGKYANWCEYIATEKYGAGGKSIWIEGIVDFKEKQMCHLRYFSGTTQYDWYFTKNEDNVYKVTTQYPGRKVEEAKVV